jgi:hypothetical protein
MIENLGPCDSSDCLIDKLLLVSKSRLVEENAAEVFHYCGAHLSSSSLLLNFNSFQGKQ